MMNSDVKEDLFDCILRLEDTHIQQGFDEGYEAGLVSGREDARHLGSRQASCSVSTKGVLPSGTLLISLFTCLLSSTSISMTSKPCSIRENWIPRTKPRMIKKKKKKGLNSTSYAHLWAYPRNNWCTRDTQTLLPISTSNILASVQTMALVHGAGVIEVACNLLNPSHVGGDDVQGLIERLGREEGLLVGKGYYTDYTADQITQRYKDLLIKNSYHT
ncbi:unnamed protein product [Brassica oleracea var. botrytis]